MVPQAFAVSQPARPHAFCEACAHSPDQVVAYKETTSYRNSRFPLRWRIGNVNPRFNLSEDKVRRLTEGVIRVWEEAAGQRLFVYDPKAGFPVNLVFDHRQERELAAQRARARVNALSNSLEEAERAVATLRDSFLARREALSNATRTYNSRLADYNRRVGEWNRRGGASSEVINSLDAERNWLSRELSRLRAEEQSVDELRSEANAKVQEYNELLQRNQSAIAQYNQQFGKTTSVKLGECVRTTQSVKSVTVFCFRDERQLAFVLAHELGHAIGLLHVPGQNSIMVAVEEGERSNGVVELSNADRRELARVLSY
jgi:hypothetical protein